VTRKGRAGSKVEPGGRYFTPREVARACVEALDLPRGPGVVIADTSAGGGAWLDALVWQDLRSAATAREPLIGHRRTLIALDIDPGAPALAPTAGDWLKAAHDWTGPTLPTCWPDRRIDAIVGNPPYSISEIVQGTDGHLARYGPRHKRAGEVRTRTVEVATSHVLRDLERARVVGLVLRTSYLEGERWELYPELWERLHVVHLLDPRVSFDGEGSDGAGYSLFEWRDTPRATADPAVRRIRWRDANGRKAGKSRASKRSKVADEAIGAGGAPA
jgi:hypothetical protein